MKQRLTLLLGVFAIMALSNAVVPVLPSFASDEPAIQGAIYSAYFLGAFCTVLPAGILSDRFGKVPFIRTGLIMTVLSGVMIIFMPTALPVLVARLLEGIAAGLFVPTALSWINNQEDHTVLSGYFFASLNLGLVSGLVVTGWLEPAFGILGGMIVFALITLVPIVIGLGMHEPVLMAKGRIRIRMIVSEYIWLFVSAVVLTGATGVVSALYPEFSGDSPLLVSLQIGAMNVATIVTSLAAPKLRLEPVPIIRIAAFFMAFGVIGCYFAPAFGPIASMAVFAVIGGVAGFAIIAQTKFLSRTKIEQGVLMGLFTTATYAGMALLPFVSGVIAQIVNFFWAFLFMAVIVAIIIFTIGKCACEEEPVN